MRVPLFQSAHEGYGDSRRLSRQYSYHRNARGWDPRWPGELRIRENITAVALDASSFKEPPISAIEWEDSSGYPLIIVTGDAKTLKYQNGSISADVTLTTTATTACLHDDGSGIPYHYTGYGGDSAGSKVQRRNRAATLTTMTNLVAGKLVSLGGDLYGSRIPASGTAASAVWKIAVGTSITQAIALPTGTVAGFAGSAINNLAAVKRKLVVLKPEGIFTYDRGTDAYIAHGILPFHADNGKVFWYEQEDLIVALGSGGAVRFDGENIYPYDLLPLFVTSPDENTTPQIVACATQMRSVGVAVTKIGSKRSRKASSHVNAKVLFGKSTDSGGTYPTTYVSQVNDHDPTTEATLDALATATDKIIIARGWPFAGVYFEVATANANAATLTAEIWTGAAWTAATIIDLTENAGGTIPLARSGWIIFDDDAADPVVAGWTPGSVTIGGTAYSNVYMMRLTWSADLSATVRISGADQMPWRPMIDKNATVSTAPFHIFDGNDRAGAYAHILASRTDYDGNHVVHDLGATQNIDEIGAVVYGRTRTGTNDERSLALFGKLYVHNFRMTTDDRPQMAAWSDIEDRGLIELAAEDMARLTGKEGPTFACKDVTLDGEDWHVTGYCYARWLDGHPWQYLGGFDSLPVTLAGPKGVGRWMQLALAHSASGVAQSGIPGTPRITSIDGEVEPQEGVVRRLQRQNPPVV